MVHNKYMEIGQFPLDICHFFVNLDMFFCFCFFLRLAVHCNKRTPDKTNHTMTTWQKLDKHWSNELNDDCIKMHYLYLTKIFSFNCSSGSENWWPAFKVMISFWFYFSGCMKQNYKNKYLVWCQSRKKLAVSSFGYVWIVKTHTHTHTHTKKQKKMCNTNSQTEQEGHDGPVMLTWVS